MEKVVIEDERADLVEQPEVSEEAETSDIVKMETDENTGGVKYYAIQYTSEQGSGEAQEVVLGSWDDLRTIVGTADAIQIAVNQGDQQPEVNNVERTESKSPTDSQAQGDTNSQVKLEVLLVRPDEDETNVVVEQHEDNKADAGVDWSQLPEPHLSVYRLAERQTRMTALERLESRFLSSPDLRCSLCMAESHPHLRFYSLQRHFRLVHFNHAAVHSGFIVLLCKLGCVKGGRGHFHCPFCDIRIQHKARVTRHMISCAELHRPQVEPNLPPDIVTRPDPEDSSLYIVDWAELTSKGLDASYKYGSRMPCPLCDVTLLKRNWKLHLLRKHRLKVEMPRIKEFNKPVIDGDDQSGLDAKPWLHEIACPLCGLQLRKKNLRVHLERRHNPNIQNKNNRSESAYRRFSNRVNTSQVTRFRSNQPSAIDRVLELAECITSGERLPTNGSIADDGPADSSGLDGLSSPALTTPTLSTSAAIGGNDIVSTLQHLMAEMKREHRQKMSFLKQQHRQNIRLLKTAISQLTGKPLPEDTIDNTALPSQQQVFEVGRPAVVEVSHSAPAHITPHIAAQALMEVSQATAESSDIEAAARVAADTSDVTAVVSDVTAVEVVDSVQVITTTGQQPVGHQAVVRQPVVHADIV